VIPGSDGEPELRLDIRVYIEDTDAGGIVFYVNYLKYFERARTEYMRRLGFARPALLDGDCMFVVHSMQVEYRRPALLDDELVATASLASVGRARLVFGQSILRGEQEICRGEITVACVEPTTRRPRVLPGAVSVALRNRSSASI
jgi:4-hydroxybenzoyl-CoA thioesterase